MDAGQAHHRLESDAFLYPPMAPFLSPGNDPAALMRAVLARCGEFSGRATDAFDTLRNWLGGIVRRNDIAFYGAALVAPERANDVDLLMLEPGSRPLYFRKPDFIHIYEPFSVEAGAHADIFLAGPLLFPDMPEIGLLRRIEAERRVLETRPFFKGGVGELITHAAFKAAESGDAADALPPGFRFRLERKWFDGANMRTVAHTPHELNEQIREQMRGLEGPQNHALALAAMRRLRVREDAQPALAQRFLSELRARR